MKTKAKRITKVLLTIGALSVASVFAAFYGYQAYFNTLDVPGVIEADYADTIVIDGAIFDNRLLDLFGSKSDVERTFASSKVVHMPGKTKQLQDMVRNGKKHIYVRLHSGGGLVNVGMDFVQAMWGAQQRGVEITCIIDEYAMSMALIIFSECDNRYATFGSKAMWHSISMSGMMRLNQQKVAELLDYMVAQNEEMWASTRIHFMPWYFVEHFVKETILDVSEVERMGSGYLRVINRLDIINQPKTATERPGKGQ